MNSGLDISGDKYMELLLTQLKHQNPMDPMDNAKMTEQVSQIATLQSTNKLKDGFDKIMKLINLTGGAELVGRKVEYRNGSQTAEARVSAVKPEGDRLQLQCGDETVNLSQIVRIV